MVVPDSLDALLVSPEMLHNPFPIYRRLREEAPVAWSERWQAWIVSRYADVEPSLKDNSLSGVSQTILFL